MRDYIAFKNEAVFVKNNWVASFSIVRKRQPFNERVSVFPSVYIVHGVADKERINFKDLERVKKLGIEDFYTTLPDICGEFKLMLF